MLLKYHAAIIATVYAFVLTTAGEEGGKGKRGGTSARENRRSGPAAGRDDLDAGWVAGAAIAARGDRAEAHALFPDGGPRPAGSRARPPY